MSRAQPTYYDILGVPPTAAQDTLKKRYRELARKYHPDVNPLPEAAQQIKAINEAYHTLGDVDRRLVYDADLALKRKTAEDRIGAQTKTSAPNHSSSSARQPQNRAAAPSAGYNGFGTTPSFQSSSDTRTGAESWRSPKPEKKEFPPRKSTTGFNSADRLLAEAKLAYINHKYDTAENLCQQALNFDKRNAIAYEIIGDIYLKRKQRDRAGAAYSYAIQFNPRNYSVQAKLESLSGVGTKQRQSNHSQPNIVSTKTWIMPAHLERDMSGIMLTAIFLLMLLGSGFILWKAPGEEIIEGFSVNFILAEGIGGVAAGGLLALYAGLRPIASELFQRERHPDGSPTNTNIGGVLVLSSIVWFYASLLIYIGITAHRNRMSSSVLRIYGSVILLTGVCSLIYQPNAGPSGLLVAAVSGNILFPCCLFGWAIGDSFRLKG